MLSKIYKLSALLLLAVLISPSVFVVGGRANAQSSAPTSLSLGEVFTPPIAALNPFNPVSEFTILGIMYDYMFSLNWPPLPQITPVMAGGYSSNANGSQWVIGVRPNLKWDNGTPLNATDLWYTLKLWNESGAFSPQISNMSILNSTSVSITLAGPNPQFIVTGFIDNGVAVLPYQSFSEVSFANLTNFQNLNNIVADGPYVITNYNGQNPLVFTANPNYWNGPPKLQTMNYYFYTSQSSEFNGYVSGQIDAVSFTGAYSGLEAIANESGHTLIGPPYATPGLTVEALLNDWVYPTNLTSFRRALAFATNVTQVNDELSGPYAPNSTANQDYLIPQYNQAIGFSNGTGPIGYSYNLTMAKQILTSAGFKYSGNTLEYPNNTTQVSLTIKYRTTVECCMASVATLLANQWGQLGIAITPTAVASGTLRGGANNASGWQVITAGVLGPQTDNGVTPGPGILNDIGDYYVLNGTQHISWNSTFYTIIQRMRTEPQNSSAFNADAQTVAKMYVQGVPTIPLFNVYNWAAVSNNFNWGSTAQNTGVYYTQAITGLPYWALSLDVVGPASSGTSTSTATTPATSTVTTSTVVASSSSTAASSNSTATATSSVATSTTSIGETTTTVPVVTSSSTTTTAGSNNTTLYAAAGIIVIIIIIAAVAAMMRRRRPPATTSSSTTPPPPS